jgi:hypothetical protein
MPEETSDLQKEVSEPEPLHLPLSNVTKLESSDQEEKTLVAPTIPHQRCGSLTGKDGVSQHISGGIRSVLGVIAKFAKFIGPGFMVAVAYIDPGNYSTDVAAGASTGYKLLFVVFMSNIFAIILQVLAVRLGTVTGMNLAEHCRAHLPRWLNWALYILAECAVIATDIAEVSR